MVPVPMDALQCISTKDSMCSGTNNDQVFPAINWALSSFSQSSICWLCLPWRLGCPPQGRFWVASRRAASRQRVVLQWPCISLRVFCTFSKQVMACQHCSGSLVVLHREHQHRYCHSRPWILDSHRPLAMCFHPNPWKPSSPIHVGDLHPQHQFPLVKTCHRKDKTKLACWRVKDLPVEPSKRDIPANIHIRIDIYQILEVGGVSPTGKSFRFVRACERAGEARRSCVGEREARRCVKLGLGGTN